jgi:hypothetical protein
MILVKNINGLIRFDGQLPGFIAHLILGLIGFFGGLVVLLGLRNTSLSPHLKLVISLVAADLYFCLSVIIYDIGNIAAGGWVFGGIGCVVDAIIITSSCFASVLTLLAITFERYLTVIHSVELNDRQTYKLIFGIWALSHSITFIPIVSATWDTAYSLNASFLVCTISWAEWSPAPILMESLALLTLMSCLSMMVFGYTRIVLKYLEARGKLKSTQFGTTTDEGTKKSASVGPTQSISTTEAATTYSPEAKRLLMKTIILTLNYVFGWSPYLIKMLYEIATRNPIPYQWDIVCTMFALNNSALNSYLLMGLDPRIKDGVKQLVSNIF